MGDDEIPNADKMIKNPDLEPLTTIKTMFIEATGNKSLPRTNFLLAVFLETETTFFSAQAPVEIPHGVCCPIATVGQNPFFGERVHDPPEMVAGASSPATSSGGRWRFLVLGCARLVWVFSGNIHCHHRQVSCRHRRWIWPPSRVRVGGRRLG
ncbi:hypothetical protein TIFTF001_011978 [Ficus carica]|uniref:Uncharacterized protein n=1 Tax=Ficus carica TaxID=3494 RepID=A0AA88DHZ6_FICCA|nr:hypothetical protein TIFTF001_011978 [Ficus carica]